MMIQHITIISDLHLGGGDRSMMSRPELLAGFLEVFATRARADASHELVIAGDFVDFLAIAPFESFTRNPDDARAKLRAVATQPPFGQVFAAFRKVRQAGIALAIIVGNHDVELAMPPVQRELLEHLGGPSQGITFYADNRAYRAGGLLVEHGNRYDGANENDWTGIRAIASALSRFEEPADEVAVSAGSALVKVLISPLKASGYSFIDLLQPQGELLALLLLAFEPSIALDFSAIVKLLRANRRQAKNIDGAPPAQTRHVSFVPSAQPDPELAAVFGATYEAMRGPQEQVGAIDLARIAWAAKDNSLTTIVKEGRPIPPERLEQIRVVMSRLVKSSGIQLAEPPRDSETEQYGLAAERILRSSKGEIQSVVMGHTHLPKHVGPATRASYVNTGTWADVIRIDAPALQPGNGAQLETFLRELCGHAHRHCPATYADVVLSADGSVAECSLAAWPH
jgi:UDP-2,3-diacylglucosamine pyrophosphatase LpxH